MDVRSHLFFCLGIFTLTGCLNHRVYDRDHYKVHTVTEVPQEEYIPSLLWDIIEDKKNPDGSIKKSQEVTAEGHAAKAAPVEGHGGGEEEKKEGEAKSESASERKDDSAEGIDKVKRFFPIQVYLVEKTKGLLGGVDHLIKFNKGGGQFDLAQYVKFDRGTFIFAFDFELPKEVKEYHVFYVSRARKRKIDGEVFGAGCKKFYDLTAHYEKVLAKNGIEVNVTRARHISAIAGTYVIWYAEYGQIFMTQITVTDSRFNDLLCETKTAS